MKRAVGSVNRSDKMVAQDRQSRRVARALESFKDSGVLDPAELSPRGLFDMQINEFSESHRCSRLHARMAEAPNDHSHESIDGRSTGGCYTSFADTRLK